MTLGGAATPFVVPPVNLAVLALLAILLRRRLAAALCGAGLLALAMPIVADGMVQLVERGIHAPSPADLAAAQAIVVLGAEVSCCDQGATLPGRLTLERLRAGAALARRTGLPLLVTGGVVADGAAPVGRAMAESLARDFALPARWVEDRSADTWENARDSAALLRPAGITRVLVVTHAWHMRRALLSFRDTGLAAIAAPVAEGPFLPAWDDLIPAAGAWHRSYYALHEAIGLAWYALR